MSFSQHRRMSLEAALPLRHRASHVRSCAVLVAQKWRVRRSVILSLIGFRDHYEDWELPSPADIERAIERLEEIRFRRLGDA